MMSDLMTSDGIWSIVSIILIPAFAALSVYTINKVSHLYSKVSEIKEDLAIKTEQYERLRHDMRNQRMVLEFNGTKHAQTDADINYLYWELDKEPIQYEQSNKAEGRTDRQSTSRSKRSR